MPDFLIESNSEMAHSDRQQLKDLYRRAIRVCHPDRAPAHLHKFLESKAKELNAAYEAESLVRVRKIAIELGVVNAPQSYSPPPPPPPTPRPDKPRTAPPPKQETDTSSIGIFGLIAILVVVGGIMITFESPQVAKTHGDISLTNTDEDIHTDEDIPEAVHTPLIYATIAGQTEVVRKLLRRGVNPNATDEDGWTALMFAAFWNKTEIAEILLNGGGDMNLPNNAGRTAWDIAGPEMRRIFRQRKIAR